MPRSEGTPDRKKRIRPYDTPFVSPSPGMPGDTIQNIAAEMSASANETRMLIAKNVAGGGPMSGIISLLQTGNYSGIR